MFTLLISLQLALASPSAECRRDAAAVDARSVAGQVLEAWTLAEEVGLRCAELGHRPRGARRWARQAANTRRSPQERAALAERNTLARLATGREERATWLAMGTLGARLYELGDLERAHAMSSRALDALTRTSDAPDLAPVLRTLANLHQDRGADAEALSAFEHLLRIVQGQFGVGHLATLDAVADVALAQGRVGRFDLALPMMEDAVATMETALGPDHQDLSWLLNCLGTLLKQAGATEEARTHLARALSVQLRSKHPHPEATLASLADLAYILHDLGRLEEARPLYEQSLAARASMFGPEHVYTARAENDLATMLDDLGDHARAQPLYAHAIAVMGASDDPFDLAQSRSLSTNLALSLRSVGAFDEAAALFEDALKGSESATDLVTATTLNNYGLLLLDLGALERARALFARSVAIHEAELGPDHALTATALNNLALLHMHLGEPELATPAMERVAAVHSATLGPTHPQTARSLTNLAHLASARGDREQAVDLLERVLAIYRPRLGPDHPDTLQTGAELAAVHRDAGRLAEARAQLDALLPAALASSTVKTRWTALRVAARLAWAEGRKAEATFWGKLAVDAVEQGRARTRNLEDALAASFLGQNAPLYREVADMLADQGRLPEAEEVLGLLKADELREFQRSAGPEPGAALSLTTVEQAWKERLIQPGDDLVADAREYRSLRQAALSGTLSEALQTRLDELRAARRLAADRTATMLDELRSAMSAAGPERAVAFAQFGLERTQRLQARLRDQPEGTVLLHAVVLDDHVRLILTAPDVQLSQRVEVDATTLRAEVLTLREHLRDPRSNAVPPARAVYDRLLRPIEGLLAQAGATRLLVYLDGVLRYVPIAALHDGEGFVAERWATAVYTAAAEADLSRPPVAAPTAVAFGATRGATVDQTVFAPLPSVGAELEAIVKTSPDDLDGVVTGELFLDEAFTYDSLDQALQRGSPWVHLASHFRLHPGTDADSFLVLGDGSTLTVRQIRRGELELTGVDLLVLSACDTAVGPRADGVELEGLAVVAQNAGARAVLASLWPVDDASTAHWMARFYGELQKDGIGHAEALQATQLAFLRGDAGSGSSVSRGIAVSGAGGATGWQHPYYWAPFVVLGAGRPILPSSHP